MEIGSERVSWVRVGDDHHLSHDIGDVLAAEESGGASGAAKGADWIMRLDIQDGGTAQYADGGKDGACPVCSRAEF